MTDLIDYSDSDITIKIMPDGNIDMRHLARAVQAALEYYRTGFEQAVAASPDEIALGKAVINCSMQAFSLECALKGVYQAFRIDFPKKHDLSRLFAGLPVEHQQAIQANRSEWTLMPETQETAFQDFVEHHKNDFVQWRYLTGENLESAYFGLSAATTAVNAHSKMI